MTTLAARVACSGGVNAQHSLDVSDRLGRVLKENGMDAKLAGSGDIRLGDPFLMGINNKIRGRFATGK